MKLSIIIPVYNAADTIDRCLKSIVLQGVSEMEVILVDDGSTDGSSARCDEWAGKDSRLIVIHKQNGGLSDARNAGIERATGDYITFADSDDYVGQDTYQPLMLLLAKRPDIDILEFPLYWHYGSSEQRVIDFGEREFTDMNDYWLRGHAYEHTYAWNKIFRRELFKDVRFPVGRLFEDVHTLPILLQNARHVVTTQRGLYHYFLNTRGITMTAQGKELKMLLEHHMKVMEHPSFLNDARYYLHVANIQADVSRLTGEAPMLPTVRVNPFAPQLSFKHRAKALIINILGIQSLCKISKTIQQFRSNRS